TSTAIYTLSLHDALPIFGEHHGLLDPVLELAHVARPPVGHERLDGLRRESANRLAVHGRLLAQEVRDEQRNVLGALVEWRQGDRSEEHTSELQSLAYLVC